MPSRIKRARALIDALRVALLSPYPEDIGEALAGIEEAARCLETEGQELREGTRPPCEARRELKLLKNDLRICARLVEHGLAFCNGMLGASPVYTSAGQAAPVTGTVGGTLSLRG